MTLLTSDYELDKFINKKILAISRDENKFVKSKFYVKKTQLELNKFLFKKKRKS